MATDPDIKRMSIFAAGLVVLAITSVIGVVVLAEFKSALTISPSGTNETTTGTLVNNTIDLFIAGIATFGTFATVLALILIAKVILGLLRGGFGGESND